jgi:hemin uptake protein HemP
MSNVDSKPAGNLGSEPVRPRQTSQADEVILTSSSLMDGRREIIITHSGLRYRLRVTTNDKLILTK